ncbi:flagellin [Hartmannibacter diazotrophicus]|uniref:Flagellin n=1 Tax=Hartmannibacter diazotrophicus TaxID=1482074 RepID=A0A2C9D7W4_9HYPH|nr:flagellin [Hartmannibacter diazotrophicus]SON56228.1 flagellin [Hartmannibacter diazotrophicus]
MGDITLSAAVRQNLLSLQGTADLLSKTQNRLSTGNKVNSALDNPNSFFTASGLNSRAGDLSNLLDDIGQGIETVKAADQGITSITKLVQSAKAKATQAASTSSQYERKQYAEQYNELLNQISDLAKDAGYKGKNLLAGDGNDLKVSFNEDNTSNLTISAVDYTDVEGTLGLTALATGASGTTSFTLQGASATITAELAGLVASDLLTSSTAFAAGDVLSFTDGAATPAFSTTLTITSTTTVQDLVNFVDGLDGVNATFNEDSDSLSIVSNDTFNLVNDGAGGGATGTLATATVATFAATSATLVGAGGFQAGDTLSFTDGNGYELGSIEIDSDTTVKELVSKLNDLDGVSAQFSTTTGKITITSAVDLNITSDNDDFNVSGFASGQAGDGVALNADDSGFAQDTDIDSVLTKLNSALATLRSQASSFGTNLSTVQIRQDFTKNLINTLQEGAGLLTLADTNEEGANILALQTRQQLGTTSLSFASQADQAVLRLF